MTDRTERLKAAYEAAIAASNAVLVTYETENPRNLNAYYSALDDAINARKRYKASVAADNKGATQSPPRPGPNGPAA